MPENYGLESRLQAAREDHLKAELLTCPDDAVGAISQARSWSAKQFSLLYAPDSVEFRHFSIIRFRKNHETQGCHFMILRQCGYRETIDALVHG